MAGGSGFHMKLLNPLKIAIDDNIEAGLTKRTFCELVRIHAKIADDLAEISGVSIDGRKKSEEKSGFR